jgi:hypothetical protein
VPKRWHESCNATGMRPILTVVCFSAFLACSGSTESDPRSGSGGASSADSGVGGKNTAGSSGSAGSAGSAAGAGHAGSAGSAGSGGSAGATQCDLIDQQYAAAVKQTKSCPLNGTSDVCTTWVDSSIDHCGYFTWGDASNTSAFDELDKLHGDWTALGCGPKRACALGGFPPMMPATCVATGAGGTTGECM